MRLTRLSAAILMVLASNAHAQVVNVPPVGGAGGGPFDDPCHGSDVMVGYNVSWGKAMNTFAAVCQAQNNGVLVGKNYGLRTWGKDYGGGYHGFETPRCQGNSAVSAIAVYVNRFHEIDSVSATCSPLPPGAGGAPGLTRTGTDGGHAGSPGSSACPPGAFAVGVVGRSGALVDSLGLKCAPVRPR